ncbi:G/U mismatch-specific DNA glycosylase [Streptomyces sp. XM4193]|uniref:G/U mismatch-specific DNA glycosylase n=1 Tax=Streptomyces sp. XM4193 TaxID=2929782 RepID=UPI001FF730D2|nr:G/U mismatch-specific DNA glycosylase [Streptomyces sp. XM4193]MCK1797996.1 G/U mismatch-specific DNA glycosylase [Streptomyces sp. XM4193]
MQAGGEVPDVLGEGLRVLFCGINPGLLSAATGHHFARPGNRFWPVLHRAGFTDRQLEPAQQWELPSYGVGITNVVARPSAKASELSADELRAGGERLVATVGRCAPRWLAVAGIGAYRTAFGERGARVGPQERTIGATGVWVLPNPSGLNASWTIEALVAAYGRLAAVALGDRSDDSG